MDQILEARGVQGVMIGHSICWSHLRHFSIENYAWVAIGRNRSMLPVNRVDEDHLATIALHLDFCEQAGHRRVGLLLKQSEPGERQVFLKAAYLCARSNSGAMVAGAPVLEWDESSIEDVSRWMADNNIDAVLSDGPAPVGFDTAEWISLRPGDGVPPRNFSNMSGVGKCALRMMVTQVEQNQRGLPEVFQTILVGPDGRRTKGPFSQANVAAFAAPRACQPAASSLGC